MSFEKIIVIAIVTAITAGVWAATPQVKNVKAFQQRPWGKVCISYEVVGDAGGADVWIAAKDKNTGETYGSVVGPRFSQSSYLSGDMTADAGVHRVVWDIAANGLILNSSNIVFAVSLCKSRYIVIDLSGGHTAQMYPVTCIDEPPSEGFNTDEYKTTKLVLRRIEPGTFMMCGEYKVTLTKPFFCGIFEVTHKQYELVMGPSSYSGDNVPVSETYNRIKYGLYKKPYVMKIDGVLKVFYDTIQEASFLELIQKRTGLGFDLPTEAQWEYACRAGTTSEYNNGGNSADDLNLLGRYLANGGGVGSVGSYLPNAWGLYDMHGNVHEWCLDWYDINLTGEVTDPSGPYTGEKRVLRGGSASLAAYHCTSSSRSHGDPWLASCGFRLVRNLSQ